MYELCITFCVSSGLFGQSPLPQSPPRSAVGFKFPGQCITAGECSCYVARIGDLQHLWGPLMLIKDITFRFPDSPQCSCKGRFSSYSLLPYWAGRQPCPRLIPCSIYKDVHGNSAEVQGPNLLRTVKEGRKVAGYPNKRMQTSKICTWVWKHLLLLYLCIVS